MKRPSNLIIAFILGIASIFLAYSLGRMFLQLIQPLEVEINQENQSRQYNPQDIIKNFAE